MSYEAVQEAQPDKKHRPGFLSPYKDGWSPEAMAHMAHLRALIEIRRHINGFQKKRKRKGNNTQYSADVQGIVKKWKQAVMGKKKEIENMDAYGYDGNRTTTTANILRDTNATLHCGSNSLRTETTT